jgi:hypothetical protein
MTVSNRGSRKITIGLESPNVKTLDMKVIKPADVITVIIEAMKQGWTPKDKDKPLCFSLSGSTLSRPSLS